ncbi:MAG: dihydrodipicolinate synthase family protein [Luteitalea sp.]|nr:dihydrodipicolinate synthase family protein [Luteitalea sp.]
MDLTGVLAPLPTPFDDRDQVDLTRLRRALRHWIASPLTGFVILGTNGEAGLMDDAECDRVVEATRALVPEGRTLIVGAGRESTAATARAATRAGELGADAVLVRTPSFFKSQMTSDTLIDHYRTVADGSPVPVLLYNFTAATGVSLHPDAVASLAAHANIVGMKESGSDIGHLADLIAMTPRGFRVLSGSGTTFFAALCAGASGGILAVSGLLPDACMRIFELARERRYEEANAWQRRLLPLARLVSAGYGVPGLKAALKLRGIDVGLPRRPLRPAPDAAIIVLQQALAQFEEVTA